ncbi:MAG: FecR family protein [Proteobacteria bacterium]|nr:FecR family protein [Pseudomonadota bacterium]MBU1388366.1 FecR family protein [Pseudomonadota bacterium]MBU1542810.1 FecR family protein [Pseudomonadota bacterium]MBU2481296.1 FecR family protein [Pseudomonadota bacterium]
MKVFKQIFLWISLFLIFCILFTSKVSAEKELQAVGFVIALRGEVQAIDSEGTARALHIKDQFFVEDTIKTGKQSRLQMMFKDNTIISLGSDSMLKIAEYEWDHKNRDGKLTSEINEGVFRIMGGLISKEVPDKLKTKTPAATIGIRGSMYAGSVRDGRLSVVFEGGRGITLQNATGLVLVEKPGYGSHVNGWKSAISPPVKFQTRDFMKVPTQMNKDSFLKRVLKTMKNPTRAEFDAVMKEAIQNGLSPQDAKQVVEELKKDPDFGCK